MAVLVALLASLAVAQTVHPPCATPAASVLVAVPTATRDHLERTYAAAAAAPHSASAAGRLAMLLHAHDQHRSAVACYERARVLEPHTFRWPYLAAVVQADLGEHANAARALREALAIDPTHLPARVRLADALMRMGELPTSRAEYGALLQSSPDLALAHHGLGRVAAGGGSLSEAVDHYRRAVQAAPQFGAAHYDLALAYRGLGRASDADAHFAAFQRWGSRRPALEDPVLDDVRQLNATARELLAQAARLGKAGHLEASIDLHVKALAADPSTAQAHVNLMSLYGRKGEIAAAEKHYRDALALGTSLADAHYNYGVLLASSGRFGDAAQAFRRALDANPFHPGAHTNVAALLAREGRLEDAVAHYRDALANNPAHASARFSLARLLASMGRNEEARHHLEEALQAASRLGQADLARRIEHELQKKAAVRQ